MNMFDIFAQAQNGNAMSMMARQFGMDERQVETAVEALMPAFSTGFKRKTADPFGVSEFFETMTKAQGHTTYFEDMTKAFQPQGMQAGNELLGQFFGSKDVSRAVARQAEAATGVGQDILKQMLPVIASALMGGMYKQTTSNAFGASSAGGGNAFGQIVEQMMKQGMDNMGMGGSNGGSGSRTAQRNPNPMDNPLGKVLEQMFGNGEQVAPDDPDDNGRIPNPMNADNNPLGKIFKDMMEQSRQPEPPPPPPPSQNPYGDLFGEMFETGRRTQETYQRSMEDIFDQYLQGMRR
ncbi:MAG: DUF937 domain-containing protein [Pseudomonadota bacterium]